MAIDFPDTPVIDETFTADSRTWRWTGVAWKIVTASLGPTGPTGPVGPEGADGVIGLDGEPGKFIVSATPPADPEEGDAWFNSTNSRLYMYYDSFWVEASAPVAGPTGPDGESGVVQSDTEPANTDVLWLDTDDTAEPLVIPAGGAAGQALIKATGNDYDTVWSNPPSPNYIINGAFDIWQRGPGPITSSGNTADQWRNEGGGTHTRDTDTPNGIGFSIKHRRSAGTATLISQRIESINSETLANKTVTLSFWAKEDVANGDVVRVDIGYANTKDVFASTTLVETSPNFTLTTSWQKFTFTTTLPAQAVNGIRVAIVSPVLNRDFYYAEVQLEAGSVATPFRRNANSIQGELAACQRYFRRYGGQINNHTYASGQSQSTTEARIVFPFRPEMRAAPTVTFGAAAGSYIFQSAGFNRFPTALTASSINNQDCHIFATTTGLTAGHAGNFLSNSTAATIDVRAEL
jgi:hypothetical protein